MTCQRHVDDHAPAVFDALTDQAVLYGVFPDRQARARCAPGVHDLGVGPRPLRDPLDEVEDEGFVL